MIQHDNDADADCVVPPNCLALDNLRQRASRIRQVVSKSNIPPIHVHINNSPLGDTSQHNVSVDNAPRGSKRRRSPTPEISTDDDDESLSISDALQIIHPKYPQLNLPQYMPLLEEHNILYAETVLEFDVDHFVELGIPEGAVRPLFVGVRKALARKRKEKKRVRVYQREQSVEI